jgi:hypothetical protein
VFSTEGGLVFPPPLNVAAKFDDGLPAVKSDDLLAVFQQIDRRSMVQETRQFDDDAA